MDELTSRRRRPGRARSEAASSPGDEAAASNGLVAGGVAGGAGDAPPPAPAALPLVGRLEILRDDLIFGWAWDPALPDEPVAIEVLDGDDIVLRTRAGQLREDLRAAGIGNGIHAFSIAIPPGFFPRAMHRVRVRRAADGLDLDGSPGMVTHDQFGLDKQARSLVESLVWSTISGAKTAQDLDEPLSFVLRLINDLYNARIAREETPDEGGTARLQSLIEGTPLSDWMLEIGRRLISDYQPLHLLTDDEPVVSVIIPVFNKFVHTYNCLRSIAENPPQTPFEIIIADDCSTDETLLAGLVFTGGVRIKRHAGTLGFVRSCNAAAAEAKGRFLFFLNNDTLVKPGWLDELVRTFEDLPDIGIVGAKLLFANGRLQEAGGIVWRLGDGWNWGRDFDASEPRFCYLRDADWVSGAALMVPAELFRSLGGFDELYAPAYYEDTDLAFRVRQAGRRVVVQPASQIVHLEGMTSGTDPAGSGAKRFQAINHGKFFQRWRSTLTSHRLTGERADDEAERLVTQRAFFIDDTVPTPDQDAGSNAAVAHMRALMELGYKVTFLPADNMAQIDPYTLALQRIGIECQYAPHAWAVEEVFRKARHKPDLVYFHRFINASKYLPLVRKLFPQCRTVFNVADLHFLRMERQAALAGDEALAAEAAEQRRLELGVIRQCDCTIVHSSFEADLLLAADPGLRVQVVPWTVRVDPVTAPFAERSGVVFVAGYRHPPNADAAQVLAREIMPLVRASGAGIVASLVGSNMTAEVRSLQCADVRAVGHVPDIADVFAQVRASIVPLRYGAGIKGKVLESFAHGIPCVMSEVAAEGLDLPPGLRWLIARSNEEMAGKVIELHADAHLNSIYATAGVEYIRARYGAEEIRRGVGAAIAAAARQPAGG